MHFPVWDIGFGLPLLIAFVAIPHVMVSHFAIGGGLFLALYEAKARNSGDSELLGYVRIHSRFFMLLTLVFGAITGVGIWFTIGLINPAATSSLILTFVWFWATEWVMFIVEIAAALVYYYGWDKMDAKTHQQVIWVYFIAAWGSLAVINGIITFMLTSGTWPQDHSVWPAFFNPTYFPSLVFRTLICFLMAGIFAFLTAAFQNNDDLRKKINRISLVWTIPTIILLIPAGYWYFHAIPASTQAIFGAGWNAINQAQSTLISSAAILTIVVILTFVIKNRIAARILTIVMVLAGLRLFGAFEWFREAARKPYVINNYMYANGLLASETDAVRQEGLTNTIQWKHSDPSRQGEDLFRAACQSCHSLTGYNGIATMVAERGWNEEQLSALIPRSGFLRAAMPPFVGTEEEAALIAGYIYGQADKIEHKTTERTGEQIWNSNCGLCHTIDATRPLRDALSGMNASDLKEVILTANELSENMPPFMGSDSDAATLSSYLESLLTVKKEGANN